MCLLWYKWHTRLGATALDGLSLVCFLVVVVRPKNYPASSTGCPGAKVNAHRPRESDTLDVIDKLQSQWPGRRVVHSSSWLAHFPRMSLRASSCRGDGVTGRCSALIRVVSERSAEGFRNHVALAPAWRTNGEVHLTSTTWTTWHQLQEPP